MNILLNLSKCCCIFSLRTGVMMIAMLNFIGAFCGLGTSTVLSIEAKENLDTFKDEEDFFNNTRREYFNISYGIHMFQFIISIELITMSIILFIGVIKEKPFLLLVWLLYSTIHTLMMCFSLILTSINNFRVGKTNIACAGVVCCVFTAVLTWYYLSVVFCFYVEVRDGPPTLSIISSQDSKVSEEDSNNHT